MGLIITLTAIVQQTGCAVRLKIRNEPAPEDWGKAIFSPVSDYVEINGPWPLNDIGWVDLNAHAASSLGRFAGQMKHDCSPGIIATLRKAGVFFEFTNGYVRVPLKTSQRCMPLTATAGVEEINYPSEQA